MKVKEFLKQRQAEKNAVLATNFYNFETLSCVMQAAAQVQAPVMLQLTRSSIDYMGLQMAVKWLARPSQTMGSTVASTWITADRWNWSSVAWMPVSIPS